MARPTQFKLSISAATERELSKLMLVNNLKYNAYFPYTAPTFQNGQWTSWFEVDVETHMELIKEFTTPITEGLKPKKGKK